MHRCMELAVRHDLYHIGTGSEGGKELQWEDMHKSPMELLGRELVQGGRTKMETGLSW
jgi:hypothetical protein